MVLGKRIRQLREERKLSQETIEKRTGLLRSYISRVENGYTAPSLETLERLAAVLEVPLHQLFHEDDGPSALPKPTGPERTRRFLEKRSKASADARQVFRTLAQEFSKL